MTENVDADRDFTLKIERLIPAPRAVVWRCWTEPDLLRQWYCPAPWQVTEADMDVKPGGRMNCVMQGPDGERIDVTGMYLEVVAEERLIFTDGYSEGFIPRANPFMTGYVLLSDSADGLTNMIWGARHTSAEDRQKHLDMGFEQGWNAAVDQLEQVAKQLC